jgi:addiction module RelB/DinJ family antitoxin
MTTSFTIRVDDSIKKKAQAVAEALGMDLSTCIRMLMVQMGQRGTLPLPRLTANGFTEQEEEQILRDSFDTEGSETMTYKEFSKSLFAPEESPDSLAA